MNQAQLLAIDSILPTILGLGGMIFLGAGLWPLGREWSRKESLTGAVIALAGAACIAVGVVLWLNVFGAASKASALPIPAAASAAASSTAALEPASSAAAPSASAAPAVSARPQASASAKPAPTPTIALTPIAATAFQADTTAHGVTVATEPFEKGFMLYRDDSKLIYTLFQDKTFKVYPDAWVEGKDPDLGGPAGQPNTFVPGRGFGWLWASDPDVKQKLGFAVAPETGAAAQVSGDGSSSTFHVETTTYVLHNNGAWSLQ